MTRSIFLVSSLLILQAIVSSGVYVGPTVVRENEITRQSKRFQNLPPYKATVKGPSIQHTENCSLSQALREEIAGYQDVVNDIVAKALNGDFKGRTYRDLGNFVDLFGARVSGSQVLEDSIDYMMQQMTENGLDKVHGEEAIVPHYVRGEERAELLTPRRKVLAVLGLVPSIGTPAEGITAEVLVVKSFDDLESQSANATGKIIVFNQDWAGSYAATVQYRSQGAIKAASHGGVATLIRSIADFSLDTPHTGGMSYDPNVTQIPSACITVEDAEMLYRFQQNGERITISLKMLNHKLPPTTSRNVIGEITGSESPYELVGLSGHIDSWDVGQGAMDDAGGTQIAVEALYLLKSLGLTPRRSLQAILWTAEEVGLIGVADYAKRHANDLGNFSAIFESDGGAFNAIGLEFAGSEEAGCIVFEILKLLNTTEYQLGSYKMSRRVSSDITVLQEEGVPGVSLLHDNDHYFWYHHTEADVLTVLDTDELDRCLAVWAATSYVLANLTDPLPRGTFYLE